MHKKLLIIRHAQTEELGNSSMLRDFDRDLTSKGISQSARLGSFLFQKSYKIDHMVCSPANRTFETAKVIWEQLKGDVDLIEKDTELYGGGARAYLHCLNQVSDNVDVLAIVGHNPDITFFAEYLTRDDIKGSMKKSTLVEIDFEGLSWAEISGNTGKMIQRIDPEDLS